MQPRDNKQMDGARADEVCVDVGAQTLACAQQDRLGQVALSGVNVGGESSFQASAEAVDPALWFDDFLGGEIVMHAGDLQ